MPSVAPAKPFSSASDGSSPIANITSRKLSPAARTLISTAPGGTSPAGLEIAAGMYIYHIESTLTGETKTGKFAVIK